MNIMRHNIVYINLIFVTSLLLTGCFGSPTAIPEDRFYTFKISEAEIVVTKYKRINIKKVHAYGIYNERAMLFADINLPLQIKRYHYHHWVMPPAHLIQHGLKDYLSQSRIAKDVGMQAISQRDDLSISVELVALERVIQQGEQSVHVELEFEVVRPNGDYRSYKYTRNIIAERNTLHAAAEVYGVAISQIYKEFLGELII